MEAEIDPDENVPEETNRRLVDHVSDYNLVYTDMPVVTS